MTPASPALLGSDAASAGDEAAAETGGVDADALASSVVELRSSAASDIAQTHTGSEQALGWRRLLSAFTLL